MSLVYHFFGTRCRTD